MGSWVRLAAMAASVALLPLVLAQPAAHADAHVSLAADGPPGKNQGVLIAAGGTSASSLTEQRPAQRVSGVKLLTRAGMCCCCWRGAAVRVILMMMLLVWHVCPLPAAPQPARAPALFWSIFLQASEVQSAVSGSAAVEPDAATGVCDAVAAALCKQAVERIARVREVRPSWCECADVLDAACIPDLCRTAAHRAAACVSAPARRESQSADGTQAAVAHLKLLLEVPGLQQRLAYTASLQTAVDVDAMDTSRDEVSNPAVHAAGLRALPCTQKLPHASQALVASCRSAGT